MKEASVHSDQGKVCVDCWQQNCYSEWSLDQLLMYVQQSNT